MADIDIQRTGLVYRGSDSHPHLRNAYFPSVVQTPHGDLIATMDIGAVMCSQDTRCYLCRSTDGGRTWSPPQLIFEPDQSAGPVHTTCRMNAAPDGRLVTFVALTDHPSADTATTNPDNGGTTDMQLALLTSDDSGATWSAPQPLAPPLDWKYFEICHAVFPVTPDRWLLPASMRLNWQGDCPYGQRAFVFISDDSGETWPRIVDVFDLWDQNIISWEQKQTFLSDGRIFAMCWAFNDKTKKDHNNHYTLSGDNGASYAQPLESPLNGQTCTPIGLEDNHVLCLYRRLDKKGLWAHLARIEDTTWQPVADQLVWGGQVDALPGGLDSRMENLHTLRFGYPTIIKLADGDLFMVFWGVEDDLSVIRWFRLRVKL